MAKEYWVGEGVWALILGSSSGFGAATCRRLARAGFNIAGVHFDRKAAMPEVDKLVEELKSYGVEVKYFNVNAGADDKRAEVIAELKKLTTGGPENPVRVLMHSLAFGTLKAYVGDSVMDQKGMDMTLHVMAHSLVYWTQDLLSTGLMGKGGRIFAMTSSGSERIWHAYGAVSAAKCALESHIRQLALELAPLGIACNTLRAGVTDTPALRKIPGAEAMIDLALKMNPHKRLTTPEDIANAIFVLSHSDLGSFLTGNIINIDGGEMIAG